MYVKGFINHFHDDWNTSIFFPFCKILLSSITSLLWFPLLYSQRPLPPHTLPSSTPSFLFRKGQASRGYQPNMAYQVVVKIRHHPSYLVCMYYVNMCGHTHAWALVGIRGQSVHSLDCVSLRYWIYLIMLGGKHLCWTISSPQDFNLFLFLLYFSRCLRQSVGSKWVFSSHSSSLVHTLLVILCIRSKSYNRLQLVNERSAPVIQGTPNGLSSRMS